MNRTERLKDNVTTMKLKEILEDVWNIEREIIDLIFVLIEREKE